MSPEPPASSSRRASLRADRRAAAALDRPVPRLIADLLSADDLMAWAEGEPELLWASPFAGLHLPPGAAAGRGHAEPRGIGRPAPEPSGARDGDAGGREIATVPGGGRHQGAPSTRRGPREPSATASREQHPRPRAADRPEPRGIGSPASERPSRPRPRRRVGQTAAGAQPADAPALDPGETRPSEARARPASPPASATSSAPGSPAPPADEARTGLAAIAEVLQAARGSRDPAPEASRRPASRRLGRRSRRQPALEPGVGRQRASPDLPRPASPAETRPSAPPAGAAPAAGEGASTSSRPLPEGSGAEGSAGGQSAITTPRRPGSGGRLLAELTTELLRAPRLAGRPAGPGARAPELEPSSPTEPPWQAAPGADPGRRPQAQAPSAATAEPIRLPAGEPSAAGNAPEAPARPPAGPQPPARLPVDQAREAASLLNRLLAEQARRHGVDLS